MTDNRRKRSSSNKRKASTGLAITGLRTRFGAGLAITCSGTHFGAGLTITCSGTRFGAGLAIFGSCRSTSLTTSCAKLERCASTTPSSNCDVLAHLRGRLRRSYEMPVGRRSRAVTKGHESSIRPSRTPQPPRGGSQQRGRITGVYCAPSARPGRAACARRGWAVPQRRRRAAPSPTRDVPDPAARRSGRTCRDYGLRERKQAQLPAAIGSRADMAYSAAYSIAS